MRARSIGGAIAAVGLCLAATSPAAPARPPSQTPTAEECAVWNREADFAKSVEDHDPKAFAAHIAAGAVFNAGTAAPLRGRDAVLKVWAPILEGKEVLLRWRPDHVTVTGDLALSRGPFTIEDPRPDAKPRYRVGWFTSVWRRDPKSRVWQVIFDGGGPSPTPVDTADAAQEHLAKARASCPAPGVSATPSR